MLCAGATCILLALGFVNRLSYLFCSCALTLCLCCFNLSQLDRKETRQRKAKGMLQEVSEKVVVRPCFYRLSFPDVETVPLPEYSDFDFR